MSARVAWMGLRGMSEDRLFELGREYAEQVVVPKLRDGGLRFVERARKEQRSPVILSSHLHCVVSVVAKHLDVESFASNRMEIRAGEATGRLTSPMMTSAGLLGWTQQYAERKAIDLKKSAGFASRDADGLLLSCLGEPCAVSPSRGLRQLATELNWPIAEV